MINHSTRTKRYNTYCVKGFDGDEKSPFLKRVKKEQIALKRCKDTFYMHKNSGEARHSVNKTSLQILVGNFPGFLHKHWDMPLLILTFVGLREILSPLSPLSY